MSKTHTPEHAPHGRGGANMNRQRGKWWRFDAIGGGLPRHGDGQCRTREDVLTAIHSGDTVMYLEPGMKLSISTVRGAYQLRSRGRVFGTWGGWPTPAACAEQALGVAEAMIAGAGPDQWGYIYYKEAEA